MGQFDKTFIRAIYKCSAAIVLESENNGYNLTLITGQPLRYIFTNQHCPTTADSYSENRCDMF